MEPFTSTAVVSALNNLRFRLGLVNAVHLLGRLGAEGTSRSAGDATQLLCAWAVRRLSSGLDPQSVADNLVAMRERLPGPAGDALPEVLAFFCLTGRPTHTCPTVTEDTRTRPRTLSRISLRATKRRTLPIPQWLCPRSNTDVKLPLLDLERRPSLPALLLPTTPPRSHDADPGRRMGTPTSDLSSPCSTPDGYEPPTFSTASLSSFPMRQPSPLYQSTPDLNSLGLSDWLTERVALVDHLLTLRYRLGADVDGWYLGVGRDRAADLLINVEAAGDTHIKDAVAELRHTFGLPVVVITIARTPSPDFAMPLHQRDVSFDLDQYLDDITPLEEDCKPTPGVSPLSKSSPSASPIVDRYTGRASITTISSVLTTDSDATMTSLSDSISISAFSIREATRELPMSAKATAYRVPDRTRAETVDEGFPSLLPPLAYPRYAKSMPNVNDTYTRMPERSRRPRSTKDLRLLPAFDLEAQRAESGLGSVNEGGHSHSQLERTSTIVKGYTFPPRNSPPFSPFPDQHSPHRPSVDDGDRSRRQKFRQCVIVDGTHVSPHPSPEQAPQDLTALGAIVALFRLGADSSTETVERALLKAVKNEEQRLAAMGEVFDAEARARLAWLLEQVGHEVSWTTVIQESANRQLARPDLVGAVDRVLYTISLPTRPLGRTPSTYKVSTPRKRISQQIPPSTGMKPLSIVVPPREYAGIELEIDSPGVMPATIRTFGLGQSASESIAESDEDSVEYDATPTLPGYPNSTPPLRIRTRNPHRKSPPNLHRRSALRHRTTPNLSSATPSPTDTPTTSPNTTPTASPSPLATPPIYQASRTYSFASTSTLAYTDVSLKQLSPPSSRLVHAL